VLLLLLLLLSLLQDYEVYVSVVCGLMKQLSDAGVVVTAAAGNYQTSLRG
jgi:hypothetical protein